MSERQVQIEVKRQGKEEKEVSCHLVSEMIEGDLMKTTSDIDQLITFAPNVGSETFTWDLTNIESKQFLSPSDWSNSPSKQWKAALPNVK